MAERRRPARPAKSGYQVTNVVNIHRANDLIYGHVGRVTYVSPEDDEGHASSGGNSTSASPLGELSVNRITDETHTFRAVKSFRTWYHPRHPVVSGDKPSAGKSLEWLEEAAPDMLAGVSGSMYHGLFRQLDDARWSQPPQTRLPLLCYGEITSLSASGPQACPAVAMAVGASGHVLRIVRLRHENRGWPRPNDISIEYASFEAREEGHWCGGPLAINQIKFATQQRPKDSIRWVLAQTAQATHVFKPTLRREPTYTTHVPCGVLAHGPSYITIDPAIRISTAQTGGRPHCDVAFNPATDAQPPQLAIFDEAGCWSVWDITGNLHSRKNHLVSVLRAQGSFLDRVPVNPSVSAAYGWGHLHRIAWLPRAQTAKEDAETSDRRSHKLLLCNATSVHVVDAEKKEDNILRMLHVARINGIDAILDMQISPVRTSHVFVLTTTSLLWLDLSPPKGPLLGLEKEGAGETKKNKLGGPLVLLSCPHLRDPTDKSLKLCLAPAGSPVEQRGYLAFVYSMTHSDVALFWLREPGFGREPSCRHQFFRFPGPKNSEHQKPGGREEDQSIQKQSGEQTFIVLPRPFVIGGKHIKSEEELNPGRAYADADVHFFQVLILGNDQHLRSALYASSPLPSATAIAAPSRPVLQGELKRQKTLSDKRRAASASYGNSFVVPDGFDERRLLRKPLVKRSLPQRRGRAQRNKGKSVQKSYVVYDTLSMYLLLRKAISDAGKRARQAMDAIRSFENPSPVDLIRPMIEAGFERGSFAFTTLRDAADREFMDDFGADLTDFGWARELADLADIEPGRVHVFDQMQGRPSRDPSSRAATLYEALARLSIAPKIKGGSRLKEEDNGVASLSPTLRQRQAWRGLLAYAAVHLFLSQISMAVVPRQRADSQSLRLGTPGLDDRLSSSQQSTPYSPHFATSPGVGVSSTQLRRFGDHHHLLSSSPAPRGVPAWLQSSSQEYGPEGVEGSSQPGRPEVLSTIEEDQGETSQGQQQEEEEEAEEDPAIARLRQYAVSIKPEPPRRGADGSASGELRLLAHWQLGSDPEQFSWIPVAGGAAGAAEEEQRRQAEEARERRRRRHEQRAQRERERRTLLLGNIGGIGGEDIGAGGGRPAIISSPAAGPPRIQLSSQVLPGSSQVLPSSQILPSQQLMSSQVLPSSQATIRPAGGDMRPKKKKQKTARGFK